MIDGDQLGPSVRITKHPSCVTGQEAEGHQTAVSVRATVKSEGQGRVYLKVMQQLQWRPLIVLVGWAQ